MGRPGVWPFAAVVIGVVAVGKLVVMFAQALQV